MTLSMCFRIVIAVILALTLSILPLPDFLVSFRPAWCLMVLLYLQFFLPDYFNMVVLLIIGLFLDVLLSTVLGEHAFALSLITWIASSKARRFSFFSIWQQMAFIGFGCFLYQTIIFMIESSLGYHVVLMTVLGSACVSMMFWPWVRLIADDGLQQANYFK